MTLRITWLRRAEDGVRQREMKRVWEAELRVVFGGLGFDEISVHEIFSGYSQDQSRRVVLAVQVCSAADSEPVPAQSHMVKLGRRDQVEKDYRGWFDTIVRNGVVSRLLSPVRGVELPDHDGMARYAVVYEDAFRIYDVASNDELPGSLKAAVADALRDNRPTVESVERLLTELYSDLFRCCYRRARSDSARAATFYRDELQRPSKSQFAQELRRPGMASAPSTWDLWNSHPSLLELRRNALWLTNVDRSPTATDPPHWLDPVDYLRVVLMEPSGAEAAPLIPETLAGSGHGDLHGLNVIVGMLRGEVCQPTLIDYGDMHPHNNLPVWDFVKMEMELKCRLLPGLCQEPDALHALDRFVNPGKVSARATKSVTPPVACSAEMQPMLHEVERLRAAILFEQALAGHLSLIDSENASARRIPSHKRSPTGHDRIDRALCLLVSLRKEAACLLGYATGRVNAWRDEYGFALAVYGLLTAKWTVDPTHQSWALMSAGVAIAGMNAVRRSPYGLVARLNDPGEAPFESHLIPLAHGARLSQKNQTDKAVRVLRQAAQDFPLAVGVRTELALALARTGQLEAAFEQVQDFLPYSCLFGDYETHCRVGRIYKDQGDRSIAESRPLHEEFVSGAHPGYQHYRMAFEYYRQAYDFSGHYYPGVNAATLALLIGDRDTARDLARDVLEICRIVRVAPDQRHWIFATEGEASLLAGRDTDALDFYRNALNCGTFSDDDTNAMLSQLNRIQWALNRHPAPVAPILSAIQTWQDARNTPDTPPS